MMSRKPYSGAYRKLVLAFDVGTTYSGISYSVLDPGHIPEIKGVNRFPAQEHVGGDSKIPSILYYDQDGVVRAVGAEAMQPSIIEKAADEEWIKVEWFKLHLRPKALLSSHLRNHNALALPVNKSIVDVFADFFRYLYECSKTYIQETHAGGSELWNSFDTHIDYVLSHPNGWEPAQQAAMRRAAILAGLITDTKEEVEGVGTLQFVTEGEASLNFCITNGLAEDSMSHENGVIIVDAGGGTIDLSAYAKSSTDGHFQEIAAQECRLQGSIFVTSRARAYFEDKFKETRFMDDVDHISNCFDSTTKRAFKTSTEAQYIKFGTVRDKDLALNIRAGQLKLPGAEVAKFFEPSILAVIEAIVAQRSDALKPISTIVLVGGFSASNWLFSQLQKHLQPLGLDFYRPDSHINKAVADGAVSFYIDHYVRDRVASLTYGYNCGYIFNPSDGEHAKRAFSVYTDLNGHQRVPNCFDRILQKGTQVSETQEFSKPYERQSCDPTLFTKLSETILCYRGISSTPQWVDVDPDNFTGICTVTADTSRAMKSLTAKRSSDGVIYYTLGYNIVILFGLTELKAQISWMEDGKEIRGAAEIVYEPVNCS